MLSRHLVIGSVEVAVNMALAKQITCERGGPWSPVVVVLVEGSASGQTL